MAKSPLAVKRKSTLSAYEPSLREKAAILGERGFKALTGREPGYEARENINRYTGLLDLLEVPGAVLSANDAARNLKSKQYGAAAGDIAGLAAGAIPIAGGALKKGAKKVVEEAVKDASKLAANFQPSLQSAIRHNGKIYIGKNHRDALAKIPTKEEQNKIDLFDDRHVGFADDKGKFLGRYDAMQYAQDFNLLRPEIKTKAGPLLVSEMLKQRPALEPTTENLVTKYDLPPVITGAEREANLARFMEGSQAPRDLYHGTERDFTEFNTNPEPRAVSAPQSVLGSWFVEDPQRAGDYAFGEGGNIMPSHVSLTNPYFADRNEIASLGNSENARDFRSKLIKAGYDGITVPMRGKGNPLAYVAFEPTQIKSKYNIGTFDPTVPHIGKAHGGPVSLKDKYGC